METFLYARVLPAAFELLPSKLASPAAVAMLLAIALQESKCRYRRQLPRTAGGRPGPARGFWQFEQGGAVVGVQRHPRTAAMLEGALLALCYPSRIAPKALHAALEHNDVLASVMARLLLFTVPAALPGRADVDEAWRQYRWAWRPGEPHPETWPAYYARAWAMVARL